MDIIATVLLSLVAFVCAYYWLLAGKALARRSRNASATGSGQHHFAIVIPAHDEERDIARTVTSCRQLDYPAERVDVYVIADNCTDATAAEARRAGATVLERHDVERRGKGYALAWALERLSTRPFDAVVVVDADCELDGHALQRFDGCLSRGHSVLQASYVASNPDSSPISYMAALGNHIENSLFYAGKGSRQAVLLRGTGMVFHRQVLERLPWEAHSLVEDAEYTLTLLRHGYRIRFLPDVRVHSPFADSHEQLQVQRTRWAQGNIGLGRAQALRLLVEGLQRRQVALVDASLTLLTLSRPLVLVLLAAALAATAIAVGQGGAAGHGGLLTAAGLLVVGYGGYFALGAVDLGLSRRRLSLLFKSPLALAQLTLITLVSLRPRPLGWARTPRG